MITMCNIHIAIGDIELHLPLSGELVDTLHNSGYHGFPDDLIELEM